MVFPKQKVFSRVSSTPCSLETFMTASRTKYVRIFESSTSLGIPLHNEVVHYAAVYLSRLAEQKLKFLLLSWFITLFKSTVHNEQTLGYLFVWEILRK